MEKLFSENRDNTRLEKLSIMNHTCLRAVHYDIHLDMKLDYTINRVFQEISPLYVFADNRC